MTMLYKNTVSDSLWNALQVLMSLEDMKCFRLVGGTSLSLQLGHRISVDIDLFTDLPYDSIDFNEVDNLMLQHFPFVQMGYGGNNSMGKTYFVGSDESDLVKIDLFYTETFIFPIKYFDNIRMAPIQEIAAMKMEVIGNGGRKKDFWDVHELLNHFTIEQMIEHYEIRYPYGRTKTQLLNALIHFDVADKDFNPICIKQKKWELIKLDFEEQIAKMNN